MVLHLTDWSPRYSGVREGSSINTYIHAFFLLPANINSVNLNQEAKLLHYHNTNRHCLVRFCSVVGQPLSKQLYRLQNSRSICERQAMASKFERKVWRSECRNGEGDPTGLWGSRVLQARITFTALRAFWIGKVKLLFCSQDVIYINSSSLFELIPWHESVHPRRHYLNNKVFLLRDYRPIVALRKFDVLKAKKNICYF